jgi:bifunctional DNA-binding transcriptional regulator/antitoxin component of YhaV-PrlF toxin-antitoxin module
MATGLAYLSLDNKGGATLPEDVRRTLGLHPGDLVLLKRTDRGSYELVPANLIPRDQLWFHYPEMRRRVTQAEAQVKAGQVHIARTPVEAKAFLDSLKKAKRR